jgi:PAS domain S-box-containing protein
LGDEQMSNELEIGKEMSKEEQLIGTSDTSQKKVQVEQIANDSSQIININNEPSNLTVTTNITNRTLIQETVLENEQRLKAIIQGLSIAAFVVDSNHRVLYWNKALEVLSNIRSEEIIGTTNHWKAFYTQERPCMADILIDGGLEEVEKWYAGKYKKSLLLDESFEATDFFPNIGGNGKWLRFAATVIRNTNGDLIGVLETLEDISERKKADEEIKKEKETAQQYLDIMESMLLVLDTTGNISLVNKKGCEILDGTSNEFTGQNWFDHFLLNEDKEKVKAVFNTLIRGEIEPPVDYYDNRIVSKKGTEKWIRWHNTIIRNKDGTIIGSLSSGEDITERKRTEDALHRSEEQYRLVTENASDVIWTMDLNFKFTYISPSNQKLTGYTTEEALELSLDKLLTPESMELALQTFTAEMQLENGEEKDISRSVTLNLNEIRVDGTIVPVEARMCLLRDTHTNPIGIIGITRDITERKKQEAALKKSEEKFVKAFKSSPVAICITRISDGNFIEVNESLEKISGYSHAELLTGSTIGLDLWVDSEDRRQVVEQLAKTGSVHDHEYRFRIKGGNEIVVRYSAEVIDFSGEPCCLSVLIDVTEQKKVEKSLQESEEKYRSIVENTQDVIILTNPDGRVSYMSPACVNVLGYTPDDLVGKILEMFYPDDVEKVHTALSSAIQGVSGSDLEYRILTKNGEMRWVSHSWSPIFTENHELQCIVSVVRNITQSKIAEQTLKEKIEELEKYKNVTVNREVKMVDLKNEINELCKKLNQKPKYPNV